MSDKWVSEAVAAIDFRISGGGYYGVSAENDGEAKKNIRALRHAKRVLLACGKADIDNDGWMNGPGEDAIIEAILAARAAEEERK